MPFKASPSGPTTSPRMTDNQDNQDDDNRDKNADNKGDAGEGVNFTSAASGHIRAGLHEEAGSDEIKSGKHAATGTSVDTVTTGEDQANIVASGTESLNKTVTSVVSEDVTGGDGGTGASINTQTGEVDPGRPGDTSRVQEAIMRATGGGGNDNDSDPKPDPNPNGSSDDSNDVVTVLRRATQPSSGQRGGVMPMIGGFGPPSSSSGNGGLMSMLGTPTGIALVAVLVGVLGFGASEVTDEDEA